MTRHEPSTGLTPNERLAVWITLLVGVAGVLAAGPGLLDTLTDGGLLTAASGAGGSVPGSLDVLIG